MREQILVTGSNGQLGSEIRELSTNYKDYRFFFEDKDLDITNASRVREFVVSNEISVIINCAAYTAVDKAESDKEMADFVNHIGVRNLAEVAKERQVKLIHISTDYVFNGTNHKPYEVDDSTNPQSVYGSTKLMGEKVMQEVAPENSVIIRTSWVYSSFGGNFVKTMIRLSKDRDTLGVISDQIGSPTYANHLAQAILKIVPLLDNTSVEVLHYSNEGACSWYDFAYEIFDMTNTTIKLNAIASHEYPTPAKRPFYSLLDKSKIKSKYGIEIPHWKVGLRECLTKMKA